MIMETAFYSDPLPSQWTGRAADPETYWYQVVRLAHLDELPPASTEACYAFLGYACDEGVRRNQGRPGAAEGPDILRYMLARLPVHFGSQVQLWDTGNIRCAERNLEGAQKALGDGVCHLLRSGYRPILLGGGHDMAFGHYLGIRKFLGEDPAEKRLAILNLDAHFDMRVPQPEPNSGTPFFQIAQRERSLGNPFLYLVAGIQKAGNTRVLYQTASHWGVKYAERENILRAPETFLVETLPSFLENVDALYVSIDLDVLSAAYAPGVSAPSPWGISPDFMLEVIDRVKDSGKLLSVDIAEFNPQYDLDGRTARLSAQLIQQILS